MIQTIGRCARNANGHVIMYADYISEAMRDAIEETSRRRKIQEVYNEEHGIVPKTIVKEITFVLEEESRLWHCSLFWVVPEPEKVPMFLKK